MTHILSIVWWIPLLGWQKLLCLWWPAVIFSCQYRKLRSGFMFFTSWRTQWWCGTGRSQKMLLFPPICSPAAGPKQPHVWNCVIAQDSQEGLAELSEDELFGVLTGMLWDRDLCPESPLAWPRVTQWHRICVIPSQSCSPLPISPCMFTQKPELWLRI